MIETTHLVRRCCAYTAGVLVGIAIGLALEGSPSLWLIYPLCLASIALTWLPHTTD